MLLRAKSIEQVAPGVYRVIPDGEPIANEDWAKLQELFPNTMRKVDHLLATEAILSGILNEVEADALSPTLTNPVPVETVPVKTKKNW